MRERYKELLDAMYGDKEEVTMEALVKYSDGRTGKTTTALRIESVEKAAGK